MDIPPSLPPLWSDNDVEIRDDGYLILKQDSKAYKKHVLRRCRDGTSGEGERKHHQNSNQGRWTSHRRCRHCGLIMMLKSAMMVT
mmetsp:Transcript_62953/g.153296  ORF Transcript_62953/g.153296 Transcript_62953/m.153296 type:complete len:85 (-) Transcript_62953:78-332(-)